MHSFDLQVNTDFDVKHFADTGLGIPVVLVVVEGGYDAITDCRKSLSQKIPVIICEGTGRAADIIAYAYTHFITTRK